MSKILIVDDSAIVRGLLTDWLQQAGHVPVAIDSPASFARATAVEQPDLVLMDVDMPGLPGTKLAALGLTRCPIVLHSARNAEELAAACRTCGAAGFIEKTNDSRSFLQKLEGFLRT